MLQEIKEISSTTKRLTINIPQDVIRSATENIYSKLSSTTRIPGFRPGKAPRSILEKRYGKNVEAEVIEKIVPEFYLKAIREANIEPVSYPNIEDKIELTPGQPLTFSVIVEVKPEIGELTYEGIELKEKPVSVDDDEVEKTIELMRESKALYSVTEETLQIDDMAVINTDAFIDGAPHEELSYKEYPMMINPESMPKEFSDALVGRKKGEQAEVKVAFEADHPNKTIAGKEVQFKVNILETKKKNIPPLDDEFAKEAGCATVDELRDKIRNNINEMKKSQINLEHKREILNELIKRHSFDAPSSMVQGEIESLIMKAKQEAERKGQSLRSDEELAKELTATATDNVKSVILIEAIGRKEAVTVTDEDIKKAVDEIAARNNLQSEEVMRLYSVREGSLDALKSRLMADKVLDRVLEKAKITG